MYLRFTRRSERGSGRIAFKANGAGLHGHADWH